MLSVVDQHLEQGEVVESSIRPSLFDWRYLKAHVVGIVLIAAGSIGVVLSQQSPELLPDPVQPTWLFGIAAVGLIISVMKEIRRQFHFYHFTDRKVIEERGVFSKRFITVHYGKITETRLQQRFYERIANIGDIQINTAGTDSVEMVLEGLRNPEHYKVLVSSKSSVASMPHDGPKTPVKDMIPERILEEELGKIQRERNRLEQQYGDGTISEWEYEREWYVLEGRERQIQQLLDRINPDNT